jgi:hypothetical protein
MPNVDGLTDRTRIEAWAGETRVNLMRLAALLAFFGHHLINYYLIRDDPSLDRRFHLTVSVLVMAWFCEVLVLYVCLANRWVPPYLKYCVTAWDLLLVTLLLILLGDARSWLATLYFLVIAAAPLRHSLPLVYLSTLGSMAAYVFFLGYVKYWLDLPADERLPRSTQVIFLLALGGCGLLAGQSVRQTRRLVAGYPVVVEEEQEREPCQIG